MDICDILKKYKNVAVVGISRNSTKTSRYIAEYLVQNGFNVAGVNPAAPFECGEIDVYKSLADIPFEIEIVDVFRRAEDIKALIPDVIKLNPKVLWLQLGIRNDNAVQPAINAGITTIQNRCIKIENERCR